MRKIRIIEQISLDGVIQAPDGPNEDGDYPHGGWAVAHSDSAVREAIDAGHWNFCRAPVGLRLLSIITRTGEEVRARTVSTRRRAPGLQLFLTCRINHCGFKFSSGLGRRRQYPWARAAIRVIAECASRAADVSRTGYPGIAHHHRAPLAADSR